MNIQIAAVTEDQRTLSDHFGMAPYYRIFTVEAGKVIAEREVDKPFHAGHGAHGTAGHYSHADMFAPIVGCRVLLCGGMGQPAYEKARAAGLEVVLTSGDIREALQAYLKGDITSDLTRIHQH